MLPELSVGQYSLVYNLFSFTIAAMLASFIFFVLGRQQVAAKYRGALVMSAIVVAVAGYHYFRIFENWSAAYSLQEGVYVASGVPFNDAYRYVDWLLTVPLLVAELVAVLALARARSISLTFRLALAAALMVVLGYPGEIAADTGTRALWGFIATLPFLYILWVLFRELGPAIGRQPGEAKVLVRNIRLLLFATWGFYPIVYLLPILGVSGAGALIAVQVGYAIADVLAKCGYGVMIYAIARAKTEAEENGGLVAETDRDGNRMAVAASSN
ncbi:MAG: bacteriorhodopsin [Chloroflexi bacterium]|nr:bacteriorhodopsin [Chloroflexota bacterium]